MFFWKSSRQRAIILQRAPLFVTRFRHNLRTSRRNIESDACFDRLVETGFLWLQRESYFDWCLCVCSRRRRSMFLILRDPGMVSETVGLRRRYERLLLIFLERFRANNHHPFSITTYLPQVYLLSIKVDCYKNEDPPNS